MDLEYLYPINPRTREITFSVNLLSGREYRQIFQMCGLWSMTDEYMFLCDKYESNAPEYFRASSKCKCSDCGLEYWRHATSDRWPWLNELCNGELVKL